MDELLECSICMDPYDSSAAKTPKMLPCQHSFCFECVEKMFTLTRVTCPTCRKSVLARIEQIPSSLIHLQLIDIHEGSHGDPADKETCQKCRLRRKDVSHHCQECLDSVIGNEVAQVVEIMQGKGQGDAPDPTFRPRKPEKEELKARKQTSHQSDTELFGFMRVVIILMIIFSVSIIVAFKASPFYTSVRRQINIYFTFTLHQISSILHFVFTKLVDVAPEISVAIVDFFHYLFLCLKYLCQLLRPFVTDVLLPLVVFLFKVIVELSTTLLRLVAAFSSLLFSY